MYRWEARTDLNRPIRLGRCHGAHTDHHVALKRPCRLAVYRGVVHRNIGAFFNMSYRNTCGEKTFFERERATQRKEDPIVLPVVDYVVWFGADLAVRKYFVLRTVRTNVFVSESGDGDLSRVGLSDYRAGLGVLLAKPSEVSRVGCRHRYDIALHKSVAHTCGGRSP